MRSSEDTPVRRPAATTAIDESGGIKRRTKADLASSLVTSAAEAPSSPTGYQHG